jgi:hypothetical protein
MWAVCEQHVHRHMSVTCHFHPPKTSLIWLYDIYEIYVIHVCHIYVIYVTYITYKFISAKSKHLKSMLTNCQQYPNYVPHFSHILKTTSTNADPVPAISPPTSEDCMQSFRTLGQPLLEKGEKKIIMASPSCLQNPRAAHALPSIPSNDISLL